MRMGVIYLKRAMMFLLVVLPASVSGATVVLAEPLEVGASFQMVASADQCTDDTFMWVGVAALSDGVAMVDTGVSVSSALGVRLEVVGVSADGIDASGTAHALRLTIGGDEALPGATVQGGSIVVHATDVAVRVSGATVLLLRRCVSVASFGSESGGGQLPSTGGNVDLAAIALAVVAGGAALVRVAALRRPA